MQLVTEIFLESRGVLPYGFSLLRQIASSPVSIKQSEMRTCWHPVKSMPSVLGPMAGFVMIIPWMNTLVQLIGRSVQPDAPVSSMDSSRRLVQFTSSTIGEILALGFQSRCLASDHLSLSGTGVRFDGVQKLCPWP